MSVSVAGGLWYWQQLDEEIRRHTERLFAERFPTLEITIGGARLRPGEGISIRNVAFVRLPQMAEDRRSEPVFVEELFLHCPVTLEQLIRRQLDVTLVTIRRPTLRLECRGDGSWDLSDLVPVVGGGVRPAPVQIEDGTLHVEDLRYTPVRTYRLHNIHAKLVPTIHASEGRPPQLASVQCEGSLSGEVFREAKVRGDWEAAHGQWRAAGELQRLQLSPELEQAFPWPTPLEFVRDLRGQANADFRWELSGQGTAIEHFLVDGAVHSGQWVHPTLSYPLTGISARVFANSQVLKIADGRANYGHTTLAFSADIEGQNGGPRGTAHLSAQKLLFDRELADLLPPALHAMWEKYRPVGLIDAEVTVQGDGNRWQPQGNLFCQDVSILAQRFPYPVEHLRGHVTLGTSDTGEPRIEFKKLQGIVASRAIEIDGQIHRPGPTWYGELTLDTKQQSIPIDDRLIGALGVLQPATGEVVKQFHATGDVAGFLRLERAEHPNSPIRPRLSLTFSQAQIQHDRFPYPLRNVQGTLTMQDGQFKWQDFVGENDSAYVSCQGTWRPGWLDMHFVADDVALEEELLTALPPTSQRIWRSLQPRGVLDKLQVDFEHRRGDAHPWIDVRAFKLPPESNLVGREIALRPTWFPYAIQELQGEFSLNRHGKIELKNLEARHGPTKVTLPAGIGEVQQDGRWKLDLPALRAERVRLDAELLHALPSRISQPLTALQVQGPPVDIDCKQLQIEQPSPILPDLSWDWDLAVTGTDLRLGSGLPLRDIAGKIRLYGRDSTEEKIQRGELDIDSMMLQKVQFTGVRGPIEVVGPFLTMGSGTQVGQPNGVPMSAQVFGGALKWQGQLSLDSQRKLDLQMSYSDGDIQELAMQLNGGIKDIRGRIFGDGQFTLHGGSVESLKGEGTVQLRHAELYELPFVVSLLSILSNKQPNKTAFTSSDIRYRLLGNSVLLDYIDLEGDAISLRGNGVVGFDRTLKLSLYSIVGRAHRWRDLLPLVSQAAQRFLEIQVQGTIDNPLMRQEILPGLNETVESLFSNPTANARPTGPETQPTR